MWTKLGKSKLLLIQICKSGRRKWVLPLSLVAIDQLWNAFYELAMVIEAFYPKPIRVGQKALPLGGWLRLFHELWRGLRCYGRWKLVEVESDETQVNIEFL